MVKTDKNQQALLTASTRRKLVGTGLVVVVAFLSLFIGCEASSFIVLVVTAALWADILGLWNFTSIIFGPGKSKEKQTRQRISRFNYPREFDVVETDQRHFNLQQNLAFLENSQDEKTTRWIREQENCYAAYQATEKYQSEFAAFERKLSEIGSYHTDMVPFKRGELYFQLRFVEESLALFTSTQWPSKGEVVLDPRDLPSQWQYFSSLNEYFDTNSAAATAATAAISSDLSLEGVWVSDDGVRLAYSIFSARLSRCAIIIRDVLTKIDTNDVVLQADVHGNVAWMEHHIGFFYVSDANGLKSIKFHRLGCRSQDDIIIFKGDICTEMGLSFNCQVSSDGKFLVITGFDVSELSDVSTCTSQSSGNCVYIVEISHFNGRNESSLGRVFQLIRGLDYRYDFVNSIGSDLWFRTNNGAPSFKLIKINLHRLGSGKSSDCPRVVIDASEELEAVSSDVLPMDNQGALLQSASIGLDHVLVVKYMLHAAHMVLIYDIKGAESGYLDRPVAELPHPRFGRISGPSCDSESGELFYQYSGFAEVGSVFRAQISRGKPSNLEGREFGLVQIAFDPPISSPIVPIDGVLFETRQEFVSSVDGGVIPVFVFALKEFFEQEPIRPKPCILYVSGGFGVSMLPNFSVEAMIFALQFGGIFCIANIRGGGEYNEHWHLSGCNQNKGTAVEDLLRVSEFLIENEYTTQRQLGLYGCSAASILIGMAINRCPWIYSAAVVEDGMFDLQAIQGLPSTDRKSLAAAAAAAVGENAAISSWQFEFGKVEDASQLLKLSPMHSIANKEYPYPAVLLVASNYLVNDKGINAQHSMKYIAALQHCVGVRKLQKGPLLISLKSEDNSIKRMSEVFTFFICNLAKKK